MQDQFALSLNTGGNVLETPSFAQIDPIMIPQEDQNLFAQPTNNIFKCPTGLSDNNQQFPMSIVMKREHALSFNPSFL